MDAAAARSGGHRQDRPLHVRARLPVVELGQEVKPGQLIAWTTKGEWHLHLSEWRFPGRITAPESACDSSPDPGEPARPGRQDRAVSRHRSARSSGRSVSTGRASVLALRRPTWTKGSAVFPPGGAPSTRAGSRARSTPAPGSRTSQSFLGWFRDVPLLETDHHPARVHLAVDRAMTGSASSTVTSSRPRCGPGPRSSPGSDPHLPPLRAGHAAKPPRRHRDPPEPPGPRASSGSASSPARNPLQLGHHGLPRRPLPADRDCLGHRREPRGESRSTSASRTTSESVRDPEP